ncbi:MAG TPA: hypothetical protein DDZ83_01060 [Nitrospinae bacterium]|nr:hypothetical protein [Nitrospinota bacterium]
MEYPNPKNERVSYTMSRIHSKDTKIEIRLRKAVWARGQWYRENYKKAPGAPDIAFVGVVVDVGHLDGADTRTVRFAHLILPARQANF